MPSRIGVLMVHGKWAVPPFEHAPLTARLAAQGYRTCEPLMPWALRRRYDVPFDGALDELAAAVAELRRSGCARVFACGHSLGASAALALAARRGALDGLILLAPGHFPERLAAGLLTTASLNLAREALASGQAQQRLVLTDCNQGTSRRLRIGPAAYLSYFEPGGPAHWPTNARRIGAALPILHVVGREDPAHALGIDYAFALMPPHPLSSHVEIDAGHADTPAKAADIVLHWLAAFTPDAPP